MKSKYTFAIILALLIIAFTGISTVSAYESTLEIYQKPGDDGIVIWHFDTMVKAGDSYSAKDIDLETIHAIYYLYTGPGAHSPIDVTQYADIKITNRHVDLIFGHPSVAFPDDPNPTISYTRVVGLLTNGDSFIAYGPGFTYIHH